MTNTTWAVVRDGKLEPCDPLDLPEGTRVLISIAPPDDEAAFWSEASRGALDAVWDHSEDDVYARLLEG